MGAQVCKCNKADLGQFELRRRDPFDSDCGDATLFASIPAPSRDEVLLDKSYRGGTDPDVQCKTGSACENADEWNTEQCGDDVATEHQSALDNTLSGAITGSIHDKPERPLVSSPPLAFTVATGTHKQPHGDLAGLAQPSSPEVRGLDTAPSRDEVLLDKSYRGGTDPDVQCKTGSACENPDEWNTEQCGDDVATEHQSALDNTLSGAITGSIHDKPERPLVSSPPLAFTVATGTHKQPHGDLAGFAQPSSPEVRGLDNKVKEVEEVADTNSCTSTQAINEEQEQTEEAASASTLGLAQPSSPEVRGLDTTVKEVEEAVDTNSCTSTQAINEEQEQTEEAASASTLQVGSNPETDSGDSISRWSQGVMQATVQADDGTTTDASGTKRPADWMEDATSARTPADWEEAPSCTNTVSASPAAAGHGEGRELCHISEWYHRVQLVEEEGQTELPALKLHAVAKELQIQECKHSPKSSLKQESKHSPKSSPRKSPSRKPGAGQRASRAEDVMLW
eukprot:CAMPEP_0172929802 /NCGR_PEP_ID=MMETSP1075-20121228/218667_1 /TAXON_ID=2916 /ORGANISM="Ceratium fusus, Strain PA161109" /LENGTH=509 /DNA_ID=CAMNT_0013791105 /DNA_START=43 /DNA_END=1573 /DNA_ORIENTATION=+